MGPEQCVAAQTSRLDNRTGAGLAIVSHSNAKAKRVLSLCLPPCSELLTIEFSYLPNRCLRKALGMANDEALFPQSLWLVTQ